MEIVSRLLPNSTHFQLDTWQLNEAENQITLTITPIQTVAHCPVCDVPARRIHSRYTRTLADLPWGSYGVRLQLHVRKFLCAVAGCKRRIFTERLCGVAPWARRTQRLSEQLTAIGLALGGASGARLSRCLGVSISHDTLLRLARRVPLPTASTPSILGIDDWAYRKRTTYGTIVVDLERRRPVTLLNDREAETLTDWLRDHRSVSLISRPYESLHRWRPSGHSSRRPVPPATESRRGARSGVQCSRLSAQSGPGDDQCRGGYWERGHRRGTGATDCTHRHRRGTRQAALSATLGQLRAGLGTPSPGVI